MIVVQNGIFISMNFIFHVGMKLQHLITEDDFEVFFNPS